MENSNEFKIRVANIEYFKVVEFSGPLYLKNLDHTKGLLMDLISTGTLNYILDFSSVEQVSSYFTRFILEFAQLVKSRNGKLFLYNPSMIARNIFNVLGMDEVIPCVESEEEIRGCIKSDHQLFVREPITSC